MITGPRLWHHAEDCAPLLNRKHCLPNRWCAERVLAAVRRRATICWVRQVEQQCRAVLPRRCSVFLASDSEEVNAII